MEWEVVDWIQLAEDPVQWRVLVNSVLDFRVPGGEFLHYSSDSGSQ
jgi:hypothetical protein